MWLRGSTNKEDNFDTNALPNAGYVIFVRIYAFIYRDSRRISITAGFLRVSGTNQCSLLIPLREPVVRKICCGV